MSNRYNYYDKEKYYLQKYSLDEKILCACGTQLMKSKSKVYDYYCPNCKKFFFKEEIKKSV